MPASGCAGYLDAGVEEGRIRRLVPGDASADHQGGAVAGVVVLVEGALRAVGVGNPDSVCQVSQTVVVVDVVQETKTYLSFQQHDR